MKLIEKIRYISQELGRFPRIIGIGVTFPLNEIAPGDGDGTFWNRGLLQLHTPTSLDHPGQLEEVGAVRGQERCFRGGVRGGIRGIQGVFSWTTEAVIDRLAGQLFQ